MVPMKTKGKMVPMETKGPNGPYDNQRTQWNPKDKWSKLDLDDPMALMKFKGPNGPNQI